MNEKKRGFIIIESDLGSIKREIVFMNWDMTSEPIQLPKSDKDEIIPVAAPE